VLCVVLSLVESGNPFQPIRRQFAFEWPRRPLTQIRVKFAPKSLLRLSLLSLSALPRVLQCTLITDTPGPLYLVALCSLPTTKTETKSTMSKVLGTDGSGVTLGHASFPHLTTIEWKALHRLAEVTGEAVVASLLSSAAPDTKRQAAQEFMERELAEANRE
jgi:hypothetical protein